MPQPGREPSPLRRAAAAAALAALVAALLYLAISAVFHWYILLASVISLGVVVVAAWFDPVPTPAALRAGGAGHLDGDAALRTPVRTAPPCSAAEQTSLAGVTIAAGDPSWPRADLESVRI